MTIKSLLLLSLMLVIVGVNTNKTSPMLATCNYCTPNGCRLDKDEFLVRTGTVYILTCVNFTNTNYTGHCAKTEKQLDDIYMRERNGTISYDGYCYKMVCSAAVPTQVKCPHAWNPWTGPKMAEQEGGFCEAH